MSLFKRMFTMGKAEAHAIADKLEDPVKLTEQGIRDLKEDLTEATQALAQVKGLAIQAKRKHEEKKRIIKDWQNKAEQLMKAGQSGTMEMSDAERLAMEALEKKTEAETDLPRLKKDADIQNNQANALQSKVNELKRTIETYENELVTLKARAKTAKASEKINKQMAGVDSSSTIAMLEKMKTRVDEDEASAQAYAEMADSTVGVGDEIDKALEDAGSSSASSDLDALKKKMGIK